MNPGEIAQLIEDMESRVERLRSLYEQYFMGIERLEPLTLRKEIDRRLWALRREQIRNTGLRFKLETTIQRYNTYQQYWGRIVREIENGTYQRDLGRAAQRFGDSALTALGRRRQKMFERGLAKKAERDAKRDQGSGAPLANAGPAPVEEAPPPSGESYDVTFEDSDGDSVEPRAPEQGDRSAAVSREPALQLDDLDFSPPPAAAASLEEIAPAPPPPPRAAPARFAAPPLRADVAGPLAPKAPKVEPPPARPPLPSRPEITPQKPPEPEIKPPPSKPEIKPPTPSKPEIQPPAPSKPEIGPPSTQPEIDPRSPPEIAPPDPKPEIGPPVGRTEIRRPVHVKPVARPLAPSKPEMRPAAASKPEARAAAGADESLSPARLRQIYGEFVEAKRRANESTATITFDKVANNLKESAQQLRTKHKGRIDFEVVMKNGKPVLKPIVRG